MVIGGKKGERGSLLGFRVRWPPRAIIIAYYDGARRGSSHWKPIISTQGPYIYIYMFCSSFLYNIFYITFTCTTFALQHFPVQYCLYNISSAIFEVQYFLYSIFLYNVSCTTFTCTIFTCITFVVSPSHVYNISSTPMFQHTTSCTTVTCTIFPVQHFCTTFPCVMFCLQHLPVQHVLYNISLYSIVCTTSSVQ